MSDPDAPPGKLSEDGRRIVCELSHLTDIASFMGPSPREMMNKPCFSCIDEFLMNPAGIIVVVTCIFFLCCTVLTSFYRYYTYSDKEWAEIQAMEFATERARVLSPDNEHPTTLRQDIVHRFRHDYDCGGMFCQLPGDPFDWSQRAMVFTTTVIVSLTVSLMFFQDPTNAVPDCTEVCTQQMENGPTVCETTCVEPPRNGLWISVVSALISTPTVFGLTHLFAWLHKPIISAIEPKKKSLVEIAKNISAAKNGKSGGTKIHVQQVGKLNDGADGDVGVPGKTLSPEQDIEVTQDFDDELKMMELSYPEVVASDVINSSPEVKQILEDGPKEDAVISRPRHANMAMLPFCYALTVGIGGLAMIYGVAANLGPDATMIWLVASVGSFALKICVCDPLKVAFAAALLQLAERLELGSVTTLDTFLAGGDGD